MENTNQQNNSRGKADFPPSLWGCSFASFSFPQTEFESYSRQVEELKENVRDMLMASKKDPVEHIEFINLLCRLGVSYHFDKEIENSLKEIFDDLPCHTPSKNYKGATSAGDFRCVLMIWFFGVAT
ncbi:hypothetical protein NC653_040873 [Populus alba x Populus x berolinensis]|uniref:Terpene synthase N-terminal domain-containing protein n=1 Tax=Populus alba x Populus x berolinensis TaxID=444605 RepID=A0AAD6L9K2_9ROSI|nr:hypothetical protein NC653_040873 [Populus alba x Populus x berolinensis]